MKATFLTVLTAVLLALAPAAHADVKSGVDAWNQGDYGRAIDEWRPLAQAGNADAQFNLGQAYKLGRGVPVDLPVALEWFNKASQQGHEKAVDNYGLLLFQQGRREESVPFLRASVARGEPRAQYLYGTLLFNGDLLPRDWVRAYALMTRASQAGVAQATASLAQMEQYVPEEQRKDGLALATAMAQGTAPKAPETPVLAQAAPIPTPRVVAARPIAAAAIPPSVVAPVAVATPSPILAPPPVATSIVAQNGPEARPPIRKKDPTPKPAQSQVTVPAAPPAPAQSGRFRIQLGAFSGDGRAQALWKSLTGKVSGLSAYQPAFVTGGGLTRLQVGQLASAADAERLCARIKTAGTACLIK